MLIPLTSPPLIVYPTSKDPELGIFTEIKDHITLIEWPELIEKRPEDRVEMFFSYTEENLKKRNIKINGYGKWSNYDFKKI